MSRGVAPSQAEWKAEVIITADMKPVIKCNQSRFVVFIKQSRGGFDRWRFTGEFYLLSTSAAVRLDSKCPLNIAYP